MKFLKCTLTPKQFHSKFGKKLAKCAEIKIVKPKCYDTFKSVKLSSNGELA